MEKADYVLLPRAAVGLALAAKNVYVRPFIEDKSLQIQNVASKVINFWRGDERTNHV